MAIGTEERLLHGIFGVGRRRGDAERDAVQAIGVFRDDLLELDALEWPVLGCSHPVFLAAALAGTPCAIALAGPVPPPWRRAAAGDFALLATTREGRALWRVAETGRLVDGDQLHRVVGDLR